MYIYIYIDIYIPQLKPWKVVPHFTPGQIIVPLVRHMISYTASDERSANLYLCMLINNFPGCDAWRYKMQMRLWALASCPHASPRVAPQRRRRSVVPRLFWGEPWVYIFLGIFPSTQPTPARPDSCFKAFPVGIQTWYHAGSVSVQTQSGFRKGRVTSRQWGFFSVDVGNYRSQAESSGAALTAWWKPAISFHSVLELLE